MDKIYQIHNIGIYMDGQDNKWRKQVLELIAEQFDGFEIFNDQSVQYRLIIKNLQELSMPKGTIVVPENSYYLPDGTIYSLERKIAYRIDEGGIVFWVDEETWFAPYLVQYILEMQHMTFVHGAGISVKNAEGENDGILLLAFGGIGKTCFISQAMKLDSVKLLGDDLIILDNKGYLRSYPRPFCVYPYHVPLFADYFSKHKYHVYHVKNNQYFRRAVRKIKRKLGLQVRNSREYMLVPPTHIYTNEKLEDKAVKLKEVFILRRMSGIDQIRISSQTDKDMLISFGQNVLMHEWDAGMRLLYNRKAQGFENIADYMKENEIALKDCFGNITQYRIVDIPENMDAQAVGEELMKIIVYKSN